MHCSLPPWMYYLLSYLRHYEALNRCEWDTELGQREDTLTIRVTQYRYIKITKRLAEESEAGDWKHTTSLRDEAGFGTREMQGAQFLESSGGLLEHYVKFQIKALQKMKSPWIDSTPIPLYGSKKLGGFCLENERLRRFRGIFPIHAEPPWGSLSSQDKYFTVPVFFAGEINEPNRAPEHETVVSLPPPESFLIRSWRVRRGYDNQTRYMVVEPLRLHVVADEPQKSAFESTWYEHEEYLRSIAGVLGEKFAEVTHLLSSAQNP